MKSNAISCLLIGQGWKQFSERKNILIFQLKSVFSTLILNSVHGKIVISYKNVHNNFTNNSQVDSIAGKKIWKVKMNFEPSLLTHMYHLQVSLNHYILNEIS